MMNDPMRLSSSELRYLDKCDFSAIRAHLDDLAAKKKEMTSEEKKKITAEVYASASHEGMRAMLGEEAFARYRDLFNQIDTDSSGTIDKQELMVALTKENVKVKEKATGKPAAPIVCYDGNCDDTMTTTMTTWTF